MLKCNYQKYQLKFLQPAGTSRGVLLEKEIWILSLADTESGKIAYGECNLFNGLSYDDRPDYESSIKDVCKQLPEKKQEILTTLTDWPSIYFGVETLLKDWENGCEKIIFPSDFTNNKKPISINGLIWMGAKDEMLLQIKNKIEEGYSCLKLKIGALDFETELEILRHIRKQYSGNDITIRVDANGAFDYKMALEKLKRLSELEIHSIEQPIRAGQWDAMAELVQKSPVPVALDEELIGITQLIEKEKLLNHIRPPYIILKPALEGGFDGCDEWIRLIENKKGDYWITSALESNIGLNAIAQYTFLKNNPLPQGLGTGKLYSNNFESPLKIEHGKLFYENNIHWNLSNLAL